MCNRIFNFLSSILLNKYFKKVLLTLLNCTRKTVLMFKHKHRKSIYIEEEQQQFTLITKYLLSFKQTSFIWLSFCEANLEQKTEQLDTNYNRKMDNSFKNYYYFIHSKYTFFIQITRYQLKSYNHRTFKH